MIFLLKVSDDQPFRFCQDLGSPWCLLLQVTLSRFQKVMGDGVMKSVEFPDFTSSLFFYIHKHISDIIIVLVPKTGRQFCSHVLGKKTERWLFQGQSPFVKKRKVEW